MRPTDSILWRTTLRDTRIATSAEHSLKKLSSAWYRPPSTFTPHPEEHSPSLLVLHGGKEMAGAPLLAALESMKSTPDLSGEEDVRSCQRKFVDFWVVVNR